MGTDDRQLRLLELADTAGPGGSDIPEELAEVLAQLTEAVEVGENLSPLDADCRDAGVAASFRLAAGDPSLIGVSDPAVPVLVLGGVTAAEAERSVASIIEVLAAMVADGNEAMEVVLRALGVHGGPFQAAATAGLDALDLPARSRQAPAVAAAYLLTTVPGDEEELVLELVYAAEQVGAADADDTAASADDAAASADPSTGSGGTQRVGVAVMLDTFAGRRPLDVLIVEDLGAFVEEAGAGPIPARVDELTVPDAIARLASALWLFDHTIYAAEELPEDSDLLFLRPMLDRLVATNPHDDHERAEVDDATRADAVLAFTRWAAEGHPALDVSTLDFVPLLVDFAADRAGDPCRWSARVAIEFLQMACYKVMAPPEELAVLPDLVRAVVRWAHARNGWPAELTTSALTAIDEVEPLYRAELDAQQGGLVGDPFGDPEFAIPQSELIVAPVGGSHPEPFDDRRIPGAIRGRVHTIVEEATARSIELFDAEFATLTRRLIADAARKKKSPFGGGKPTIWAAAVVYAVAQLNEIPGGWSPLARPAAEITGALDGAPTTIANKARELRALLDVDRFPPEPRYQHSTSAGSTGDLLSTILGLMPLVGPVGDLGERGGLRLVPLGPSLEPGSVDPGSVGADCFVLRVSLADIRPVIWRLVRVPVDATFGQLHELLQMVFDWYDSHLHSFEVGSHTIGPSGGGLGFHDPDSIDEDKLRLCDAVRPGSEFVYRYDFGDNWEHRIVVESTEDVGARTDIATGAPMGPFALLAGKRAGPPEDCGGWIGYADVLAALKDRNHPRRAELAEWLPPGFDPKRFDPYIINQAVHRHLWSR